MTKIPSLILAAVLAAGAPALAADHLPVRQGAHDRRLPDPPHLHDAERQVHRLLRHDPGGSREPREVLGGVHDPGEERRHQRARRDDDLRSANFFDVANHPTITFKSTSVKANGKDSFVVTGDLTMHGVTKAVALPVTLLGEGKDPWGNEKMGLETAVTLNRKDYGLTWNKTLESGGLLVGDEVKVQIGIEANKAKAQP